jgi:MoxR-like ATPase
MNNLIEQLQQKLRDAGYIADKDLVTTLVLMEQLGRPLLVEGEAGVGKTEIAKVLSRIYNCSLIRLQCYDGLDANNAVYEWNYSRQLLSIKLLENSNEPLEKREAHIFHEEYLLERPLLKAIRQKVSPVLLIDEIDRTDEAFEAFLLELLSDFQISIPELGTIHATSIPRVVLTSNGTRELSDALRRRCLYHYVDYPDPEKELLIIRNRVPGIEANLSRQVVSFVQALRHSELRKRPGVAETLDWSAALLGLGVQDLKTNPDIIYQTRACLLKTQDDMRLAGMTLINRLVDAVL